MCEHHAHDTGWQKPMAPPLIVVVCCKCGVEGWEGTTYGEDYALIRSGKPQWHDFQREPIYSAPDLHLCKQR